MFNDKRVIVVMLAYNAAKTLRMTYDEVMSQGIIALIILVYDASRDDTAVIAKTLPCVEVFVHDRNRVYGSNQKKCYRMALERGAIS
jgi:glycosyltransferase involved in cell wall biosynthesis